MIVVSKKPLRRAVDRNRARRRVRAALQQSHSSGGVAVYLRREVLTTPFLEIARDLKHALE